jgi:DNA-binding beta-propeller fold protein YncE
MRRLLIVLACGLAGVGLQAADVYHPVKEIAIGGEGGWDYLVVDPAAHRLYTSHATKIVVADTETGKVVGEIPDLPGVHGIAIAPDLGRGFTSNGRTNTSTIVDLKTLKPLGTVATGANPDSIRYSPSHKEVWAFNHTGKSVTVFDAQTAKVLATIQVGGELEEAVEDPAANRMYVNVEDKGAIGVMDTRTHTLVATWPIAGCEGPTGLAFDQKNHLLLSACDGKMAVTDSASGKAVTSFPIADDVDGNGFDPATGYAFASSRTGVLTIAHEDAPNKFTVVQTLKTQPSGRTMTLDPVSHNVYVPVAMTTPGPNGRAQITANTMKVLVFGR